MLRVRGYDACKFPMLTRYLPTTGTCLLHVRGRTASLLSLLEGARVEDEIARLGRAT